ncbi:Type I Iterative PKS [Arachnomyces sp. PD_36]|nr:Type I Iterative PKS [Arachnomyces sp. PD_36]
MAISEPIAIIGTGCRFPGGASSPSRLWSLLQNPRDIAKKVPAERFNIDAFYHPEPTHHGTTNVKEAYFLEDDLSRFDAPFFNVSNREAESLDPQQRILLETVYESLERAGLRLKDLQGSSTGVFCGVMTDDYSQILGRDIDGFPRYMSTGTARNNVANRVSYFFDWQGPSMSIDTACSSSLAAVNLAVRALREGDCNAAVAAGTNLIISPTFFLTASNLSLLSPRGRSRMWDAGADGYARGEGVASVFMKRLSDAVRDGDPIECIIRETMTNQDGRTMGITMPSSTAQAKLIRSTYAKAGLSLERFEDHCQYFEAHGTGTQAGDPQEAAAIAEAFFPHGDTVDNNAKDTLLVGSIKTLIGHTEATAGLAGLIKASLSIKNGVITPNLHLETLNPKVAPFCSHLRVPTASESWPQLPPGVPRRASVNSFGFGGTNVHVILESYESGRTIKGDSGSAIILPYVFSAASERSLDAVLDTYSQYLRSHPNLDHVDLAWSLFSRRDEFPHKFTLHASSIEALLAGIQSELELRKEKKSSAIFFRPSVAPNQVLGIFTGQGAQWPQMGLELITTFPIVRVWMEEMQASLDNLPMEYRPPFSLVEELAASERSSRLSQAGVSQLLCTAVAIVQVNILRLLGISFSAVIGHSSGEIVAAYAAGFLTASDAIRVGYLRGFVARLAGANSKPGAMLAAGLSVEEASDLVAQDQFYGRISVAAFNSPTSVTLAGDADAMLEAQILLQSEGKFARALKVDTAYHSHHMRACSQPYLQGLRAANIKPRNQPVAKWYSSVQPGQEMSSALLTDEYWNDNMLQAVQFSGALAVAVERTPSFNMMIEVGPHPALKGPVLQTLSSIPSINPETPYVSCLKRGISATETFATAIGSLWTYLGADSLDLKAYFQLSNQRKRPEFLTDLPTYPFDRTQSYWAETAFSKSIGHNRHPQNQLLGRLNPSAIDGEYRWRNYLYRDEIEWLDGHRIQGQTVFPATGYVAMALEATGIITDGKPIRSVEIYHFKIDQAIAFDEDNASGVETVFKWDTVQTGDDMMSAEFSCHASFRGSLRRCAYGNIEMEFGHQDAALLPCRGPQPQGLNNIDTDEFYSYLSEFGYGYSGLFRGITSIDRKRARACGSMINASQIDSQSDLRLHPAMMDTLLQTLHPTIGAPFDGQLHTLSVPTGITRITINPYFSGSAVAQAGEHLSFDAILTKSDQSGQEGDTALFDPDGNCIIQIEGVKVSPLMAPTAVDDRLLFSEIVWGPLHPDASLPNKELSGSDIMSHLSSVAAQLTFRYPRMKILEIGAGNGTATKAILGGIGRSYHSYTYTEILPDLLEEAQESFKEHSERFLYRPLDIERDPKEQGFEAGSYDFIVAANVLHEAGSLESSIAHTRSLLKPGGYLLVLEPINPHPIAVPFEPSGQECPWASDGEGAMLERGDSEIEWDKLLRRGGFSGIDTITPGHDTAQRPLSVFLSQAVDDKIRLLRDPFASEVTAPRLGDLVIVGGATSATSKLVKDIEDTLMPYFSQVIKFETLEAVELGESSSATVLNISDVDKPCFMDMSGEGFESLKSLVEASQSLLWVTAGPDGENPYQSMSKGLMSCLSYENFQTRFQHLNIVGRNAVIPSTIAAAVLRVAHADLENDYSLSSLVWSTEPELRLEVGGGMRIPRLKNNDSMNRRYMSNRRAVYEEANVQDTTVQALRSGESYELVVDPRQPEKDTSHTRIRVNRSTSMALKVEGAGFLHLVIGRREDTKVRVVALSKNHTSMISTPSQWCWTLPYDVPEEREAVHLKSIVTALLAANVVNMATPGSSLLVHEADSDLRTAISARASSRGVRPYFTTCQRDISQDRLTFLNRLSPTRALVDIIPAGVSAIVRFDKGSNDSIFSRLESHFPEDASFESFESLCRGSSLILTQCDVEKAAGFFSIAQQLAGECASEETITNLVDVHSLSVAPNSLHIVDWSKIPKVQAKVQPASSYVNLSRDKTYLLVGMTGDLGRSICQWMASRGARNFALASRNPKVETWWIDEMERQGIKIVPMAMDVTDKASILNADSKIRAELPPVGGVVNGAMILADMLFSRMSLDDWQKTIRPKVEGSTFLNELYNSQDLDFFILMGSLSGPLGNRSQSSYSAANIFMSSIIQSRRARNLVGSIINPAQIIGVGYVSNADSWLRKHLNESIGCYATSELDLHELFAEAILAGRPESGRNPDLISGFKRTSPVDKPDIIWYRNPKTWHFIEHHLDTASSGTSSSLSIPIKAQLESVSTTREAIEIIEAGFIAKIRSKLQMSEEDSVTRQIVPSELGVDSLVAVDLRTWFVKEVGVEVPILKILGGSSIGDLAEEAAAKLPVSKIEVGGDPSSQSPVKVSATSSEARSTTASTPNSTPSITDTSDATSDTTAETTDMTAALVIDQKIEPNLDTE